jgi:hypothetical protein
MGPPAPEAPWWLKLIGKLVGVLFVAIAVLLTQMPRLLGRGEWWVRLIYVASAVVFAIIGYLFLKLKPEPSTRTCPQCGRQNPRRKLVGYCAECGHTLFPGEDELKPSEINCPFCDEPMPKGTQVCPKCAKMLPGFGIETVKGRACCRWCKTALKTPDQKFCTWCSAPLRAASAAK